MPSSMKDTIVTLLIGIGGVGVAAAADALGVPPVASSLIGLAIVVVLIVLRRFSKGST